jgi:hypothetical protein
MRGARGGVDGADARAIDRSRIGSDAGKGDES